ncbi:MAG: AAA family ATPase [Sphingomonadaceae bacterium]
MNKHTPLKNGGSLLERASEVFDFRKAMADNAPDAPAPAAPAAAAAAAEIIPLPVQRPVAPRPHIFVGRHGTVDRDALRDRGFIVPDAPVGALGEEFRLVKRQLLLETTVGGASPKARVILIASARPNEGKTFCAINLALSIAAEKDTEVLLVDADFAKPEILSTLGLESGLGLMDALADPSLDIESCVIRTDIPGFSVLPAGRQTNSDTEQLASAHTQAVLENLVASNPARIVILDSPPALAASPASVLALHAGQCVMVVKADQTSEAELRDALGLLHGCENIQLLLNAVRYDAAARSFGSYYGYGD